MRNFFNIQTENKDNQQGISPLLTWIISTTCAIVVANLYYIQPLLGEVAQYFHVSQLSAGIVATLTQVGFATGIILVLPIADIMEKKSLISIMLIFSAVSLLLMFFSTNFFISCIAALLIGFTSVITQLLVPLAAQLATPSERGGVIGKVTSGLLLGILLSRVTSGLLGNYFGWKIVYLLAAIMMVILAVALRELLPECPPQSKIKYVQSLKSMVKLTKDFSVLREASISGAMAFGAFSAFWTSLTFLLEEPVYHMGADIAGLFGLLGIIGALGAPFFGKVADKKGPKYAVGIGITLVTVSYLLLLGLGLKIWGLIPGVIILDLGTQICNVCNQARVQQLTDEARNRVTAVYVFSYFVGGALGSLLSSFNYIHFGWTGVCILGLFTQLIAISIHSLEKINLS